MAVPYWVTKGFDSQEDYEASLIPPDPAPMPPPITPQTRKNNKGNIKSQKITDSGTITKRARTIGAGDCRKIKIGNEEYICSYQ